MPFTVFSLWKLEMSEWIKNQSYSKLPISMQSKALVVTQICVPPISPLFRVKPSLRVKETHTHTPLGKTYPSPWKSLTKSLKSQQICEKKSSQKITKWLFKTASSKSGGEKSQVVAFSVSKNERRIKNP